MSAATDEATRVVIADDHPVFLAGLRVLFDAIPAAEVVGEATNGREVTNAARRLRPHLVLMDIDMPELNGIEATRAILAERPETAILILTMLADNDSVFAAMRAGARGYMLKGAGLDDIARAIDAMRSGGAFFGREVAGRMIDYVSRPPASKVPFPELTSRERVVLELVADGCANAEIAQRLGLSIKTVRNYLSRIFVKLQVVDRTEAAVRARREGLGH